jgi:N-acyl-D-amino-acid deacylase
MQENVMKTLVILLGCFTLPALALAQEPGDARIKEAIHKGLERIKAGVTNYPKHRDCFSCHHQAMAVLTLTTARKRGFPVQDDLLRSILAFSLKTFENRSAIAKGKGVGGGNNSAVYALQTFAAAGHPHDKTMAALVEYLLARQRKEGHWTASFQRPPTMGSSFTNTGLAIAMLKKYAPPKDYKGAAQTQKRIDAALAKGRAWLLTSKPVSTEDRVFHLRGLVEAGCAKNVVDPARAALLKEQRADGSWSQLAGKDGDAYATGTVLAALRHAGLEATHDVYKKGIRYLLNTQRKDGSWVVQTRARPLQRYFDNGDAGGRSQFISYAATGWAVIALLETMPDKGK